MMAGWIHNLSVDTHHDLCHCVSQCARQCPVYNKIWAWSRQMGWTMPVSQCYRADLKRKIFWCLLGEATPLEVTLSLVTGATMESGTLQLTSVAKLHQMCSAAMARGWSGSEIKIRLLPPLRRSIQNAACHGYEKKSNTWGTFSGREEGMRATGLTLRLLPMTINKSASALSSVMLWQKNCSP